jgi:general secretion pathway protein G
MSFKKTDTCSVTALKAPWPALDNRGMTLIELILVSAIIGILATMAIPAYSRIQNIARQVRSVEEIRVIEKSVYAVSIDKGGGIPGNLIGTGQEALRDPWGNLYVYRPIAGGSDPLARYYLTTQLNSDFDLYSTGPNGATDADIETNNSKDDIVRTGDGGSVEPAIDIPPAL